MNIMLLLLPIAGSIFVVLGIFQVVMDMRTNKQRKVVDRLTESRGAERREQQARESLLRKRMADVEGNPFENMIANFQVVNNLQRVLDQADVNMSASKLLVNLSGLALLAGIGLALLGFGLLSAMGCSAAVLGLPLIYLIMKRKRRIRKMINQLPDVFELLGQALRAGHSLASGIQLVSQQMPDPIAGEFARVFQEQNLGIKIEEAMLNMANRVDQMDMRFFVTSVLIQRQTGGDLAEILDKIGAVIRDRIKLLGTVQALTAEGRLSGWVLFLLPVVVFFVAMLINPEYGTMLINTDAGRIMLLIAIGMDLMGMAMIKKIVNIKV